MIWLTWQQHRKQALATLAGFFVLAAVMFPIGLAMHHTFDREGITNCLNQVPQTRLIPVQIDTCDRARNQFSSQYGVALRGGVLFMVLPLLAGLFWGAPLVSREVEQGTHRLVWTQSISRRRWGLVKFGLIGGFILVVAAGYALGMSWWLGPLSRAVGSGRFSAGIFDVFGLAPIGYTLFAVCLGIFAGTVWSRVLPAMAATLVGFLGLRIVLIVARPHYLPAHTLTYPVRSALKVNRASQDWALAFGVRNTAGRLVLLDAQLSCPPGARRCDHPGLNLAAGDYNWLSYQPADRFWLFQGIETGVFVVLAFGLLSLALRRIRRIA